MDKLQKEFEAWVESEFRTWAIQSRPGVYGSEQIQDMWKAWQAALSANGGEAVTPVWDNKVLVSNIVRAFWRRIYTYKDRYPAKELPREVPIELYFAMSTALMHLDNESLNPKHPAPPSVAVPEGFCLERGHRLHYARTGEMCSCPKYVRHPHCDRAEMDETLPIANPWLTTAPSPDHIADAGKVVQERLKDSATVHAAMLRGEIAKPTNEQIKHLYPELATPSVPENDNGVSSAYDSGYLDAMLYARVCCDRLDNPENTKDYRDCARFLDLIFKSEIDEAARLRTAGDEGEK